MTETTSPDSIIDQTATATYFVAGSNLAGFMPDTEPAWFTSAADARAYIIGELLWHADHEDSDDLADELAALAEDVNLWSTEDSATDSAGRAWWVQCATETIRVIRPAVCSFAELVDRVANELPAGLADEDRDELAETIATLLDI